MAPTIEDRPLPEEILSRAASRNGRHVSLLIAVSILLMLAGACLWTVPLVFPDSTFFIARWWPPLPQTDKVLEPDGAQQASREEPRVDEPRMVTPQRPLATHTDIQTLQKYLMSHVPIALPPELVRAILTTSVNKAGNWLDVWKEGDENKGEKKYMYVGSIEQVGGGFQFRGVDGNLFGAPVAIS